jgi:glyoxylase-like metal-dependent hydrolase (beta-lactamase superfamily II)
MLHTISENLFRFEDTCNVYVVKNGSHAVLIDFGSGRVLDHLGELDITQVDWILHTHHHRDQCQGDKLANEQEIPIAVPAHELPYFEEVEVFWGSRQIYNIYDVRQSFFTLAESIRVARVLIDYETFEWGPYRFLIQPTPGHTLGHISLIAEIDGTRIAFSGDLIAEPGKVQTLYDLQYSYSSSDGSDYMVYSLAKMRDQKPDLLCPSHGEPFGDTAPALRMLEDKFREYLKHRWGLMTPTHDVGPVSISPHLIQIPGCSNTWIVVSDSGKALFVDYGSQSFTFMYSFSILFEAGNRLRMQEHNLDLLRDQFGVKQIDLALPSHYHDDHVNGLPYLQKHHGTRIWCYENMTDIMQHPHGYKLGCTHFEPVTVERSLEQGETFKWEEYEFQVFHTPGHADYHMAMFGTIDGKRVAFSGDEVNLRPGDTGSYSSNNIWRNHVHANSHEITGKLYMEHQPELTCPGHGGPFEMDEKNWQDFHDWCLTEQRHWRGLAAAENLEEAVYPDYVFLYPYQPPASPGSQVRMQVWFENIHAETSTLEYNLVLPDGWSAKPDSGTITAEPGKKAIKGFTLQIPDNQSTHYRRQAFTLDATVNGKHLGQLAEAVVDLRPELDWGTGGEHPRRSLADG